MSVFLIAEMFRRDFGSASRKLLAVRLADHADDHGRGIWPSVNRIATECNLSARQVSRMLKSFVAEGILKVVKEGGRGPGSTTRYDFDLSKLPPISGAEIGSETDQESGVDDGQNAVDKGDTVSALDEKKGDRESPLKTAKGDSESDKGDSESDKGDSESYKPSLTVKNRHSSHAGARDPADAGEREGFEKREGETQCERSEIEADRGEEPKGLSSPAAIKRAFKRFAPTWPTWVSDSEAVAWKAWQALTDDERSAAKQQAQTYHAACKAAGRQQTCSLGRYLSEKEWLKLPESKPLSAEPPVLKPYGPTWWAHRRDLCAAGKTALWRPTAVAQKAVDQNGGVVPAAWIDSKLKAEFPQVARLDQEAEQGRGPVVAAVSKPDVGPTQKVQIGSEGWAAFVQTHQARGWPVPSVRRGVEWLEVPILDEQVTAEAGA